MGTIQAYVSDVTYATPYVIDTLKQWKCYQSLLIWQLAIEIGVFFVCKVP